MATVDAQVVEQGSLRGAMLEYLTEGRHFVLITVALEEHDGQPGLATGIESSITDPEVVKAVLTNSLGAVEEIQ